MVSYGITVGYQEDKCSICKKKKEIRIIYDRDDLLIAKVCDDCSVSLGNKSVADIIKEYGKKTTVEHIEILSKEQLEKSGFDLTGVKKDIKKKLKEIKKSKAA